MEHVRSRLVRAALTYGTENTQKYTIYKKKNKFRNISYGTDIFLFPSSHAQLTIHGKIRSMFRLEKAIIRFTTGTLKRKN